jgi:hypothetical protein
MMRSVVVLALVLCASVASANEAQAIDALTQPQAGDPFSIEEKSQLKLSVDHRLQSVEVVTRLHYLLDYWKMRFNIASEWHGNRVFLSGSIYGVQIRALFAVHESTVSGFAKDPGWPLRNQVVNYVNSKLKKYLHPAFEDP